MRRPFLLWGAKARALLDAAQVENRRKEQLIIDLQTALNDAYASMRSLRAANGRQYTRMVAAEQALSAHRCPPGAIENDQLHQRLIAAQERIAYYEGRPVQGPSCNHCGQPTRTETTV